jgi:hypothetical protein
VLKDLKETNPVEVAEDALANKILEEPAFAWWARRRHPKSANPESQTLG